MKLPRQAQPILRITGPIKSEAGLGDVVKRLTGAMGIRACGGCQRRAAQLNRWVVFSPPASSGKAIQHSKGTKE